MNEAKRKNILFAVVAVVIAVVFFFAGFGTGFGVGKGAVDAPDADAGASFETDGGMQLSSDEDTDKGVSLTSVKIAREAYDEYDIMPIAETAYTVTATVSGDGLTEEQKGVTWSEAAFKNPSSTWATGKNVSDYIKTTPNGNQLTVQCLQAFGEQIVIKCSSSYNLSISKDLTVDYMDRPTIESVTFIPNYNDLVSRPPDWDSDPPITDTVLFKTASVRPVKFSFTCGHSAAYTLPYAGEEITGEIQVRISEELSADFLYSAIDAVSDVSSVEFPYVAMKARFPTLSLQGVTVTSDGITSNTNTFSHFFDSSLYRVIFETPSNKMSAATLQKFRAFVAEGMYDLYYEVVFVQADGTETVIFDSLYVDLSEIIEACQSASVSGIGFGE